MIISRRIFLTGCASLPAVCALRADPLPTYPAGAEAGIGEVWGLRFWARDAVGGPVPRRTIKAVPAGWHPEFS